MKYSKFNTIIDKDNYLLVYNSLSGALLKIPKNKISENTEILLDKGILVENEQDEILFYKYIYYHSIFTNKDFSITIAPTTDCNLCCPYCFENGNKHKEYIDSNIIQAIAKYLITKKKERINITWFGGEPLLCFDSMLELTDSLISNGITPRASIITNGTLFKKNIIDKLYKLNLDFIQITLDGEKEEHDQKRFFHNKKGSFDIIIANINQLLELTDIQIVVKVNIDKTNYESCCKLITFLKKSYETYIKKSRLKIISNYIRNRTNFEGCDSCLTEAEYSEFQTQFEQSVVSIPRLHLGCPLRNINSMIIGPDGSIYKCLEFIGDKSKSIGNIALHSVNLPKLAKYVLSQDPFEDKDCTDCSIFPICGGGCPVDRAKRASGENISLCPSIKQDLPSILEKIVNQDKLQDCSNE